MSPEAQPLLLAFLYKEDTQLDLLPNLDPETKKFVVALSEEKGDEITSINFDKEADAESFIGELLRIAELQNPENWPIPKNTFVREEDIPRWKESWSKSKGLHAQNFLNSLKEIGAVLVHLDPENPTQYFQIAWLGEVIPFQYDEITKGKTLRKLKDNNRPETISKIVADLEIAFPQPEAKDIFYGNIQLIICTKKNLESEKDDRLNYRIYHIVCGLLKAKGFRLHTSKGFFGRSTSCPKPPQN